MGKGEGKDLSQYIMISGYASCQTMKNLIFEFMCIHCAPNLNPYF